ncbi:MAG: AI-2E family transporter [Candidatus Pacearchaeota archaeon]
MTNNKKVGWYISLSLIGIIFILAIFIIRPIIFSILAGLILAYVLYPIYIRLLRILKEKTLTSLIICLLILFIIIIPSLFVVPIVIRQMFEAYLFLQKADFIVHIKKIFPSTQISSDFHAAINNFINKLGTSLLNKLTSFILNFQNILLHGTVIFFVLFFALRDWKEIEQYIRSLSPFSTETEDIFFNKFKDVTNSILFGQVIIGIVQGIVTGIGFLIFGVKNILTLTLLTMIVGVLPIIGPWLVWIPVDISLFVQGKTGSAIGLLIYGILIISWIDVLIRPLIVSQKTKTNSGIILIGMIGGLLVFGVLGLILGPLILEYSLIVLEFYRNKKYN